MMSSFHFKLLHYSSGDKDNQMKEKSRNQNSVGTREFSLYKNADLRNILIGSCSLRSFQKYHVRKLKLDYCVFIFYMLKYLQILIVFHKCADGRKPPCMGRAQWQYIPLICKRFQVQSPNQIVGDGKDLFLKFQDVIRWDICTDCTAASGCLHKAHAHGHICLSGWDCCKERKDWTKRVVFFFLA